MFYRAKFLINYLGFAKNPKRTELIFKFVDALRFDPAKHSNLQMYEDIWMANEGFRKMWEDRYFPKITMEHLEAMPKGSFGSEFRQFLMKNNLDLNFYPEIKIRRPLDFFILRQYKTHDMLHLLLDMDISHRSELAVQAFTLAQTESAIPVVIMSAGLLHEAGAAPQDLVGHFEAISQQLQKGRTHEPIYGLRVEDFLELPLAEARQKLLVPKR